MHIPTYVHTYTSTMITHVKFIKKLKHYLVQLSIYVRTLFTTNTIGKNNSRKKPKDMKCHIFYEQT